MVNGKEKYTGNTITLTHRQGPRIGRGKLVLNRHWLRDGCQCSSCVDPHSGQKNFGTTDVPLDLPISSCRKTENGALEIVWQNDFLSNGRESHTSTYSAEQVDLFFTGQNKSRFPPVIFWDKQTIKRDITFIEYDDWMNNDKALAAGVKKLHTHGILFIRNAPHSEESVISMSSRIGNLQETLYGRTWDVRSKPEAENVAYTSSFLGLHQDMLYLKDPPRLQLLHCLENSCDGGESLFSDASRAAHLMKIGPPELRDALSSRRVAYHYKKHGHHYENNHSVIDSSGHVRWSPPFQAPLRNLQKSEQGVEDYRTWAAAAVRFQQLLEQEEFLFEYKMQPGDCVIFDNLRVVHGRRAFDTSAGSRWLKGTYNAHDVFMSKLRATDESDA
ncbi:TfdA family Taurine catabolism dioxygenase TauD [Apiospora marii]|uniref:TfdA family Taurine catabolism dioxygenase TauD n=1 Tax=Apiospora marii TaxID=335849 RepID=UPI00312D005C